MGNSTDRTFGDILVGIAAVITAFPLFIMFHKRLPAFDWPFGLDRILLFALLVFLLVLILRAFRVLVVIAFVLVLGWLSYGSLTGNYGFQNVYRDYRAMLFSMQHDPDYEHIVLPGYRDFPQSKAIRAAIDPNNPVVRQFAVSATNEFFREAQRRNPDHRNLIQAFAIFKKINSNWNYVDDPREKEYFAPAAESAQLLAGDCDDHAILMAACLKAIGAVPRLVLTTGHLYPELLIGNKGSLDNLNYLIKKQLFPNESLGQDIHYHRDADGKIWINLDYTAHYPGGQFMADPVLGIIIP